MRIQMAYDYMVDGKKRKADSLVTTDTNTGRALIAQGVARKAEMPKAEAKSEATKNTKEEGDSE